MDFKLMLCTIISIIWGANPSVADGSRFNSTSEHDLALLNLLQDVTEQFNSMLTVHFRDDHAQFRKLLQVDGILDEDWSDMERIFPYNVAVAESPNSRKHVVLNLPLGTWDFSEVPKLSQPDIFRYVRYTSAKMLEDASLTAWLNFDLGQIDAPKFLILVDMKGMKMHTGLPMNGVYKAAFIRGGIKALVSMGRAYTSIYRKTVNTLLFVNVPCASSVICEWTADENFRCGIECQQSESEQDLDGMKMMQCKQFVF